MSRKHRLFSVASAVALAAALSACGSGAGTSGTSAVPAQAQSPSGLIRHPMINIREKQDVIGSSPYFSLGANLYDAPIVNVQNATFNLALLGVDAIDALGNSWQLISYPTPQPVNLLALQQSPMNLGSGLLPNGVYTGLQLLFDPTQTTATINGTAYPVRFISPYYPWWSRSNTIVGVTAPIAIVGTGSQVTASIDFNLFQSAYLSNGVVYVLSTAVGGVGQQTVTGTVVNAAGAPVASATVTATDSNGRAANTTLTGADGSFVLHGIGTGAFTLSVANSSTTASGQTVTAVGNDAGAAPSRSITVGPNAHLNIGSLAD